MIGAVRFAGKFAKKIGGGLTEKSVNGRALSNIYTGRDLNGKGKALAGLGIAGYAGYQLASAQMDYEEEKIAAQGDDPDLVQSLPGTRADGISYNASPYSGPKLEATGDLVFALHKIRHGG
jgi:hypothetical protein